MPSSISSSSPPAGFDGVASPGLQKLFRQLPLFLAGMVGMVLVAEIGLRLAGISYPDLGTPDLDRGWGLRPGAVGVIRDENKAGVLVRINSDGLRDQEHALTKEAGTLRIAVLGNSYTEALHVPLEQTYWWVMGRELERCGLPGVKKVEVINFGVGGYGTAQELITLRTKVFKYQPDVVVLGFLTSHDVLYNSRALNQQPQAPYFVFDKEQLRLDGSFRSLVGLGRAKRAQMWIKDHSLLLQLLLHTRTEFRQWVFTLRQTLAQTREAGGLKVSREGDIPVLANHRVYVPPQDQTWEEAWKVTEALVRTMKDEVHRNGATFLLATLTNAPQVHPDVDKRQRFMGELTVPDLFYPDRRIAGFASSEGIPFVALAEQMAGEATRTGVYWHGFPGGLGTGHWNETGNRRAGTLIAERLCAVLRSSK